MIQKLTALLIRFCEWRGSTQHVTGRGTDDVYMTRYILFRSPLFSIYIHQFLRSDRDSYHDHPWNFWTYVVSGSYIEHRPDSYATTANNRHRLKPPYTLPAICSNVDTTTVRSTKQNRLARRYAAAFHWVQIDRSYNYEERRLAPTTICLVGRRQRAWGFYDAANEQWVYWKKYLGVPIEENEELKPSNA